MEIAIVAVAYNRIDSLSRLLNSLDKAYYNDERVTLIISVDKSNTDQVELFADQYEWKHGNKIVDKHNENLGLRSHMLSLGKWFDEYDALIVLEDDIVVSSDFYNYSKQTSLKYRDAVNIAGISLYSFEVNYQTGCPFVPIKDEYDIYFMNCAVSWGEVWLRDSWKTFYDWYLLNQDFPAMPHLPECICKWNKKSWLKYHIKYCIEMNKYFIFPYTSLSTNFSDSGVHNANAGSTVYQVSLQNGNKSLYALPSFGESGIYYDGFFENKMIYKELDLPQDDLCLDLCNSKSTCLNKRYWLTTKFLNYRVVRSYGLNYRPIEANIFNKIPGSTIFLYDTSFKEKNNKKDNRLSKLYPYKVSSCLSIIRKYGVFNLFRDIRSFIARLI